jgi:hypothetical protein
MLSFFILSAIAKLRKNSQTIKMSMASLKRASKGNNASFTNLLSTPYLPTLVFEYLSVNDMKSLVQTNQLSQVLTEKALTDRAIWIYESSCLLRNLKQTRLKNVKHLAIRCDTSLGDLKTGASYLPDGLTTLNLGYLFNQPLGDLETGASYLPDGLIRLWTNFNGFFNQSLGDIKTGASYLPDLLTNLYLGRSFNQPLGNGASYFPDCLTTLQLGRDFKHPLCYTDTGASYLPIGLTTLRLGYLFKQPLIDTKTGTSYLPDGSLLTRNRLCEKSAIFNRKNEDVY